VEKLIYLLWKRPEENTQGWSAALRGPVAAGLLQDGAKSVQIDLVDDAVAAGAGLRLESRPVPDGLVMLWMDTANRRQAVERRLAEAHARIAGYLVTESRIKDEPPVPVAAGERSWGFSLIGFLQRPPRLTNDEWLKIWLGSHTAVAVETQPTFRYVQNVITRRLTDDAPVLDALVEEGFSVEALNDPAAFYDAVANPEKHRINHARMMESCNRFIDFDRIDSLPMSEFMVKRPAG
jgi:hypothetical protein